MLIISGVMDMCFFQSALLITSLLIFNHYLRTARSLHWLEFCAARAANEPCGNCGSDFERGQIHFKSFLSPSRNVYYPAKKTIGVVELKIPIAKSAICVLP